MEQTVAVKQLVLTPAEAGILEISLHGADTPEFPKLPLLIARALASGQNQDIGVIERELWFLRRAVDPKVSIGKTTGLDLITKVCKLIVEYDNDEVLKIIVGRENVREVEYARTRYEDSPKADEDPNDYAYNFA